MAQEPPPRRRKEKSVSSWRWFNARRRPLRRGLDCETHAGHLFAERPKLIGDGRIDSPGPHAAKALVVGWHGLGDVAILAIDAALALELRIGRAPDAGGRPL